MDRNLTVEEILRYKRHLSLSEFGNTKQLVLKKSKVLIIGAGGLGSPVGLYLAAAGIGTIGVVDYDVVDVSNLQRQIAHSTNSLGKSKAESIINNLKDLNPLNSYKSYNIKISAENISEIIKGYELIIDGSDNFQTRFLLADACYLNKLPLLHGSIYKFDAQVSLFIPGSGPCYRCLFKEIPPPETTPNCSETGVLGPHVGVVGSIMAIEAIKFLTKLCNTISGRLIVYNSMEQNMRTIKINRNPACTLCGEYREIKTELLNDLCK